jgi:hypothetical protein
VWSSGVIVDTPFLDDRLGFLKAVEDLAIEQFISQLDASKNLPESWLI